MRGVCVVSKVVRMNGRQQGSAQCVLLLFHRNVFLLCCKFRSNSFNLETISGFILNI